MPKGLRRFNTHTLRRKQVGICRVERNADVVRVKIMVVEHPPIRVILATRGPRSGPLPKYISEVADGAVGTKGRAPDVGSVFIVVLVQEGVDGRCRGHI